MKYYDFRFPGSATPPRKNAFSSTPGFLSSVDDYYLLDSGLSVMETTNGVFPKAVEDEVRPDTVMSWLRVMVANNLATSGQEWTSLFGTANSGT